MACKCKEGYLEKYSIGSRFTIRKNWQKRYMKSTPEGLQYYKTGEEKNPKGFVPYGFDTTLFTNVDQSIHPEAIEGGFHYFAIQFADPNGGRVKMLLLKTLSIKEKAEWCEALATMMARAD
eukprot:TRINITY_DN14815_c0_g1_i1.p2 TRINITY_DN14815_c0_g1~~TRINITY_DN14815_c0_g1_i1.p2  ORF type:complete len:121 (+),score=2.57 TRINITY_DN14815_c0_g1_i1:80-442(+)